MGTGKNRLQWRVCGTTHLLIRCVSSDDYFACKVMWQSVMARGKTSILSATANINTVTNINNWKRFGVLAHDLSSVNDGHFESLA